MISGRCFYKQRILVLQGLTINLSFRTYPLNDHSFSLFYLKRCPFNIL